MYYVRINLASEKRIDVASAWGGGVGSWGTAAPNQKISVRIFMAPTGRKINYNDVAKVNQ